MNRHALAAATILLVWVFAPARGAEPGPAVEKSVVVYAIEPASIGELRTVNRPVARRMLDNMLMALTGQRSPTEAWRSLIRPTDTVGIKVATSGGPISGTRVETAFAVIDALRAAGVPGDQIVVWDRGREDLLRAGFKTDSPDYKLRWIDPVHGYDETAMVTAPLLGRLIWGDAKFGRRPQGDLIEQLSTGDQLSNQSFFAKVLTGEVTRIIHIPSLSDSFLTGVHGALADMTLSNIDNWRRFARPPQHGDPYLVDVYADPVIYDKVVLTILDALFLQYAGGPLPHPHFTIENHALFASRDPVAIDATARRLINEARVANRLPKVDDMSRYIDSAEYYGLGSATEETIELIRVGAGAP